MTEQHTLTIDTLREPAQKGPVQQLIEELTYAYAMARRSSYSPTLPARLLELMDHMGQAAQQAGVVRMSQNGPPLMNALHRQRDELLKVAVLALLTIEHVDQLRGGK